MDASLGSHGIGKSPYLCGCSSQNDGLDAEIVIEMAVHAGDRKIVMIVLKAGKARGKISFVMVIDVGEICNARSINAVRLSVRFDGASNQIPDGFRAIAISARGDELVKLNSQCVIKRDGETFHAKSFLKIASERNFPLFPEGRAKIGSQLSARRGKFT